MQSSSDTTGIPASATVNPHRPIVARWLLDHLSPIGEGIGAAWGISLGSYIGGPTYAQGLGSTLWWQVLAYFVATELGPPVARFATFQCSDEICMAEVGVGSARVVGYLLPSVASRAIRVLLWRRGIVPCGLAALLVFNHYAPRIHPGLSGSPIWRYVALYGFRAVKMLWEVPRAANRRYEAWEARRAERSSTTVPALTYDALDAKRREIRVLRLRRRTWHSELACDFVTVSVDDAERLCPFEAISYTWRGETRTAHILVGGRRVAVTPTVARFLRYRRSFFGQAFLWIDAVCINQDDMAERGSQVLLMGDIYRHAKRTRIWLAHPNEARDASHARGVMASVLSVASLDDLSEEMRMAMLQHIVQTDVKVPALAALFARSYFHRVWVVQEVALAKEVLVMYGDIVMSWDALVRVTELLSHPSLVGQIHGRRDDQVTAMDAIVITDDARHMSNIGRMDAMRKLCWNDADQGPSATPHPAFLGMEPLLVNALRQLRSPTLHHALTEMELYCFHATDPHDKLFGVLGLVSDPGFIGPEGPDYREPVRDLYVRTARYLIAQTKSLSVLQYAGIRQPPLVDGLPSWVPDWHDTTGRRIAQSTSSKNQGVPYKASNQDGTEIEDPSRLEVEIKTLDTVVLAADRVALTDRTGTMVCGSSNQVVGIADLYPFTVAYDDYIALASSSAPTQQMYPDLSLAVFRLLLGTTHSSLEYLGEETDLYETFQFWRRLSRYFHRSVRADSDDQDGANTSHEEIGSARWTTALDAFLVAEGFNPAESSPRLVDIYKLSFRMGQVASAKRFCIFAGRRIALLPSEAQVGDLVAYIRTAPVPFVLRIQKENCGEKVAWELVGSCYVYDMSDGCLDEDGWTRVFLA